jgi:hypothetical protein
VIITGVSAILQSSLQNVPGKLEARRERRKAGHSGRPATIQGRPDLRNNFAGCMRAALDRFSHLPLHARRPILIKDLVAAAVAFVIGMGAIYAVEKAIGNSLSCGLWSNCPKGASPGVHLGGGDGTGTAPTINLGRAQGTTATPQNGRQNPLQPQNPTVRRTPAPAEQQGVPRAAPGSDQNSSTPKVRESAQPQTPQEKPVIPGEEPVVKPGSGGQTPREQNPPEDGASAPGQQNLPAGGDRQQPSRSR